MNKSFTLYGCSDGIEERAVVTEITIESLVDLYKKKEFSTLVECGQQFVKGNPSSAIAWNLLALGHRYSGNVPAALKIYEDLLKLNPNNFLLSTISKYRASSFTLAAIPIHCLVSSAASP